MTRRRYDGQGTEFSNWLREVKVLDSSLGYRATNVDYIWALFSQDVPMKLMLIEEKRHGRRPKDWQRKLYHVLDYCIRLVGADVVQYYGYHELVFEHTNPEDGNIFWDGNEITKNNLIEYLKFEGLPVLGK